MSASEKLSPASHACCGGSCPLLGQKRTCALQKVMSALPPKADICSGLANVRYGPKRTHAVQKKDCYSITSLARASSEGGTAMPSTFAVLRLMTSSSLVGNSIGRWATGVPLSILYTYVAARWKQ